MPSELTDKLRERLHNITFDDYNPTAPLVALLIEAVEALEKIEHYHQYVPKSYESKLIAGALSKLKEAVK